MVYKGPIDHSKVNDVMLTTDLLLHCSDHENNSMVIREAIASNLPFVSTPTGDHMHLSNMNCGLFSEGFSSSAIAALIASTLNDEKNYEQQIESIQKVLIPTWSELADKFLKFVDQFLFPQFSFSLNRHPICSNSSQVLK